MSENAWLVWPPVRRHRGPASDRKLVPGKYPTRESPHRCAASSPALCTRCPYSRTAGVTGPSRSSPNTGAAAAVSPNTAATPGVTRHTSPGRAASAPTTSSRAAARASSPTPSAAASTSCDDPVDALRGTAAAITPSTAAPASSTCVRAGIPGHPAGMLARTTNVSGALPALVRRYPTATRSPRRAAAVACRTASAARRTRATSSSTGTDTVSPSAVNRTSPTTVRPARAPAGTPTLSATTRPVGPGASVPRRTPRSGAVPAEITSNATGCPGATAGGTGTATT